MRSIKPLPYSNTQLKNVIFLKWFKLSWLKSLFLCYDGIFTPANDGSGFGILDDVDDDDHPFDDVNNETADGDEADDDVAKCAGKAISIIMRSNTSERPTRGQLIELMQ